MAFDVGSIVAKVTADISGFQDGIKKVEGIAGGMSTSFKRVGDELASIGQKAVILAGVAAAGIGVYLKSASQEANNFERSMTTLDIIAGRFGVSGMEAQQAAKELGMQLRIGTGSAAESLQNLLKTGLSLDKATDLLKRFTNEAITGKSPQIDLATAVQNLSFAYATNNSAIGNLSGINENFVNIIEKGKQALLDEGVAANSITEEMAKYRGMIDLTNLTMGSSERFTGTLIDKQAELQAKLTEVKVSIGTVLNDALVPFADQMVSIANQIAQWLSENQTTVQAWAEKIAAAIMMALQWFGAIVQFLVNHKELVIGFFAAITLAVGVFIAGLIIANAVTIAIIAVLTILFAWLYKVKDSIIEFAQTMIARFQAIQATVEAVANFIIAKFNDMVGRIRDIGNRVLDAIMWPFNEAKKRIEDAVNFIKDRLDFTKRHSPSVLDIVNRGVSKVNRALGNLDWDVSMAPNIAAGNAVTNNLGPGINNVVINLDGAMIGDVDSAGVIAERIGDSIVKRLQMNVRF